VTLVDALPAAIVTGLPLFAPSILNFTVPVGAGLMRTSLSS
jgi:hypothetical protein